MKAKDYRNLAWQMLKENDNYWSLFVLILAIILITGTGFGGFFLTGVLLVGLNTVIYKSYREKELDLGLVFEPFTKERYLNSLVAHLLKLIFIFLWSLLFIIPGIIKAYSYSMTSFLLADNKEMSGQEAIEESKRIMSGNKKRLFFLDLSFIGWILLSLLTLGIGFLFLAPYVYSARTAFYLDLVKEEETVL